MKIGNDINMKILILVIYIYQFVYIIYSFLDLWDSRADDRYYIQRDWSVRENMVLGQHNIMQEQLVNRDQIILLPLYINIGLMNNVIKDYLNVL